MMNTAEESSIFLPENHITVDRLLKTHPFILGVAGTLGGWGRTIVHY